jgi:hypothetical protein
MLLAWGLVLLGGCGGTSVPPRAEDVVKQWANAINVRQWGRACKLTSGPADSCETWLRSDFDNDALTFEGPATNGGGTAPGESYFSLRQRTGGWIYVTAVPKGDTYTVRLEAAVKP